MDALVEAVARYCSVDDLTASSAGPMPVPRPVSARLAICLRRNTHSVFASYGNLAQGRVDSFSLVPAKHSLGQRNAESRQQSLVIHGALDQPGLTADRGERIDAARSGATFFGTIRIPRWAHQFAVLILGWSAPLSPKDQSWASHVASELAAELAALLPTCIAELEDEWAMLGLGPPAPSPTKMTNIGSSRRPRHEGDESPITPKRGTAKGGIPLTPRAGDKDRVQGPIASPRSLEVACCGYAFKDPLVEQQFLTFSAANQAPTDLLSMIVGAVLGISCFVVLKNKHAHATWYRSNLPWGHVFCFIQMAYVVMMFPAVITQAQWYIRLRTRIIYIRVLSLVLMSGILVVPYTALPGSDTSAALAINVLVNVPLVQSIEGLGSRVGVLVGIPLRLAVLALTLPAVPVACRHDTRDSWLLLPCTYFGMLCHLTLIVLLPLALHAWTERRERAAFISGRRLSPRTRQQIMLADRGIANAIAGFPTVA